jgi:hypothetical protein
VNRLSTETVQNSYPPRINPFTNMYPVSFGLGLQFPLKPSDIELCLAAGSLCVLRLEMHSLVSKHNLLDGWKHIYQAQNKSQSLNPSMPISNGLAYSLRIPDAVFSLIFPPNGTAPCPPPARVRLAQSITTW